MKISYSILLALQALSVAAAPSKKVAAAESVASSIATVTGAAGSAATSAAAAAPDTAVGGAEEEKDENEVEQEAQFGDAVNIGGGNVKTDTLFPKGKVGGFEVEIQNAQARLLRVTENQTPGGAPPGFTNIEGVSYKVEIGGGGSKGFTLAKIDYIGNEGGATDLSTGQIGRLCTETNSFVIGAGVGDLEFEVEENELTMTVADLVGEWAIFLPDAAASGGGAAGGATDVATGEGAEAGAGAETGAGTVAGGITGCGAGTVCRNILDLILGAAGNAAPK